MKRRITSLDFCRGLMLLSMTFNHLGIFPFLSMESQYKWIWKYVYGIWGFFSNSEGFFFLAGTVTGIVYGKMLLSNREKEVRPRVRKRVSQMYLGHVLLLAGLALIVFFSDNYVYNMKVFHEKVWVWKNGGGIHYFLDHPIPAFFLGSVFLYTMPYFDILPMYMLFLAITPFILKQLHKGRVFHVLCASFVGWFFAQYLQPGMFERILNPHMTVRLGWFHPLAQQLLFVGGLTLGFLYVQGKSINAHKIFSWTIAIALAVVGWFVVTGHSLQNPYHLGILRVGTFAVKAYAVFLLHRFLTFSPIALIGKYSLAVFNYHVALCYFLLFFFCFISEMETVSRASLFIVCLSSIWVCAYICDKRKEYARAKLEPKTKPAI